MYNMYNGIGAVFVVGSIKKCFKKLCLVFDGKIQIQKTEIRLKYAGVFL